MILTDLFRTIWNNLVLILESSVRQRWSIYCNSPNPVQQLLQTHIHYHHRPFGSFHVIIFRAKYQKNVIIVLCDWHYYTVTSIPTNFYPCFTFRNTLLYGFWICELMEWSQKTRLILPSANFYVFAVNVLLFIPADSAWTVCEPLELCISSQSLNLQSVPARSERCETTSCIKIKLFCGWRSSSELQKEN